MLQQGEAICRGELTRLTDVLQRADGTGRVTGHGQVLGHIIVLLLQTTAAALRVCLHVLLIHLVARETLVTVVADVGEDRVVVEGVVGDEHLLVGEALGTGAAFEGVLRGVVGQVVFTGEGLAADGAAVRAVTGV